MFICENLKTDHGRKAYKDSDCALKINEGSIAKNMPLLREFSNYDDWGADTTRWVMMLYNRAVNFGLDYVVNNPMGRATSKIDVCAGGFLKHKAESEIGENEKAISKGEEYDSVGCEWTFEVLRGKCRGPGGAPIVRIAKHLCGVGSVLHRELRSGVRNPSGF